MTHQRIINFLLLASEVNFSTSRSSGPGGQNVNKVNSKVTLRFNVPSSAILTETEKEIISGKLASRIGNDGDLTITVQDMRSQLQNKEQAIVRLDQMIARAFQKKKIRRATRPTKGSVQRRITGKKLRSQKKKQRRRGTDE